MAELLRKTVRYSRMANGDVGCCPRVRTGLLPRGAIVDTGFEPVTSSMSRNCATAAPIDGMPCGREPKLHLKVKCPTGSLLLLQTTACRARVSTYETHSVFYDVAEGTLRLSYRSLATPLPRRAIAGEGLCTFLFWAIGPACYS